MKRRTAQSLSLLAFIYLTAACSQQAPVEATQTPDSQQKMEAEDYAAPAIIDKTLPEIIDDLKSGTTNSVQLVETYLSRIEQIDQSGPRLQSIISINPDALKLAKELDQKRAEGEVLGPLHGVPVLLKDNIDTKDNMPTTAGSLALKDNFRTEDSPLVSGLRESGAIILGKTNLSQWANFRSQDSMSGWSSLGGQVRNPHILNRNPCGSSSGSGAAAAASLAAGAVGTETNGSIICPSNANGVVGFKPTVGIVPQQGIIPIAASQDTAGPMTKSVEGAAVMMNAMAINAADTDFTGFLSKDALSGKKVGVLSFSQGEYEPISELFAKALYDMEAAGAELVYIQDRPPLPEDYWTMSFNVLKYEFKTLITEYLASTDAEKVTPRSLEELIAFNNENASIELSLFDQSLFDASQEMGSLEDEDYLTALATIKQAMQADGIDKLFADHGVDVLVAPSGALPPAIDAINGDVWPSSWPGYGSAAAVAGYPHATVPMGQFRNLPLGVSFIGTANQDAEILGYAYAYEQQSMKRVTPKYLPSADADPKIAEYMSPYKP